MRWSSIDPRQGWRRRFALFPVKIGEQWLWLEKYEARHMGEYREVRTLEDAALSPEQPR